MFFLRFLVVHLEKTWLSMFPPQLGKTMSARLTWRKRMTRSKSKKDTLFWIWIWGNIRFHIHCYPSPIRREIFCPPWKEWNPILHRNHNYSRKWHWRWRRTTRTGWRWWSCRGKHVSWCNPTGLPLQAAVHVHGALKGPASSYHWFSLTFLTCSLFQCWLSVGPCFCLSVSKSFQLSFQHSIKCGWGSSTLHLLWADQSLWKQGRVPLSLANHQQRERQLCGEISHLQVRSGCWSFHVATVSWQKQV